MSLFNSVTSLLQNQWFWIIFTILMLTTGLLKTRFFRRIKVSKGTWLMIGVIGIIVTMFGVSWLGVGTVGSTSAVQIARIQTTTPYTISALVDRVDSGVDDTRQSDFYINETDITGDKPIEDGVFLLTRKCSNCQPASCTVKVIKPPRYDIADTTYHIVVEDQDTGVMQAYVETGSESAVATPSSPKETAQLSFAEGVTEGYVAFNITIDDTGFDPLSQYDVRSIDVDMCGYAYRFNVHKEDA